MQYKRFGVMIDCSRNGVLRVQECKKLIAILAKMGYNCVELYMEDTYKVETEPYFGYLRGGYTAEELKELDDYCLSLGIELIPCIQTLAHFTATSKVPAMRGLFDTADILLCESERTYEFLEHLFEALSKNIRSRTINIGMDEAHMLGLGKYLDKNGYKRRFDILTNHLSRVNQIAQKYGYTPHIWSDMLFRLQNNGSYYGKGLHVPKDVVEKIPENVELCYWDYYTKDDETYDDMFAAHLETGRKVWFAGGAWCWRGFAPFNKYTLSSMKPAMQAVRKYGVENVLITLWGDNGKECSYNAVLPALYTIKQYAEGNFDEKSIKEGFEKLIGISYDDFCLLDLPNLTPKFDFNGWPKNPCKCLFYQDCFLGIHDIDLIAEGHIPYEEYTKKLTAVLPKTGKYKYIFTAIRDLSAFLECKAELGIQTRAAYRAGDNAKLQAQVEVFALGIKRLQAFYNSFSKLWRKENKDFGWEVQDVRLGGLMRRLKTCKRTLEEYLGGKRDAIEELDCDVLATGNEGTLFDNNYVPMVTPSNL